MALVRHIQVRTEKKEESFQSKDYLTATKGKKKKRSAGRKMADGSKNVLILKTFSNSKNSIKPLFFLF